MTRIFSQCAGVVRRTVRRLRVQERDRDDVEQEVWLAIWRALDRMDGAEPADPAKFAGTIAFRKARDHRRAEHRSPEQAESSRDPEPLAEGPTPEEQLVQREEETQARAIVLDLLDALPEVERAVIVLADFEPKHSMREIAEELDISEDAARARHRRARERMTQVWERRKRREAPQVMAALLPGVAALSLNDLVAVEGSVPPLAPADQALLWDRVTAAIEREAPASGERAAAPKFSAAHIAAAGLLVFALGGAADEAVRALRPAAPTPVMAEREVIPALIVASPPPPPSAVEASAALSTAPIPTAAPSIVTVELESEWQAIRDARALLRGKRPSPEAALEALRRVERAELRDVRDQLRAEAERLQRSSPGGGTKRSP